MKERELPDCRPEPMLIQGRQDEPDDVCELGENEMQAVAGGPQIQNTD